MRISKITVYINMNTRLWLHHDHQRSANILSHEYGGYEYCKSAYK